MKELLDELSNAWGLLEITQVKLARQHYDTKRPLLLVASQGIVRAMDEIRAAATLVKEYEND